MLRQMWVSLQGCSSAFAKTSASAVQRCQLATTSPEAVEVCFVDPALILEPERLHELRNGGLQTSIQPYLKINLPRKLAQGLGEGRFQLGDADDPESHWLFGRHGEIFEYKYCGSFAIQSGFASAINAQLVHALEKGQRLQEPASCSNLAMGVEGKPRNWTNFVALVSNGGKPPAPFMFAGRVIDCQSAGLYRLMNVEGDVEGVMISSEYETAA